LGVWTLGEPERSEQGGGAVAELTSGTTVADCRRVVEALTPVTLTAHQAALSYPPVSPDVVGAAIKQIDAVVADLSGEQRAAAHRALGALGSVINNETEPDPFAVIDQVRSDFSSHCPA
jgi:hypothetical protein